jgi:hypothetical protein
MKRTALFLVAALGAIGCSVNLGGQSPVEYDAIAVSAPAGATAEEIAETLRSTGAAIALVTAPQDSAWFARVADISGLALSGPGQTESPAKAFFTNLEILGDTSIVLGVGDGTRMHMHDALYQISENRLIDLMMVGLSEQSDIREAARTLLSYIATDVGANAAIILGVQAPSPQVADSLATLLRAAYSTAWECAGNNNGDSVRAPAGSLRLFYGPSARLRCASARSVETNGTAVAAHLIVGR